MHIKKSDAYLGVTSELNSAGVPYEIENGGRHKLIVFEIGGRRHKIPITTSGRQSHRLRYNARAMVRRLLGGTPT
jgi:hypothetical protein